MHFKLFTSIYKWQSDEPDWMVFYMCLNGLLSAPNQQWQARARTGRFLIGEMLWQRVMVSNSYIPTILYIVFENKFIVMHCFGESYDMAEMRETRACDLIQLLQFITRTRYRMRIGYISQSINSILYLSASISLSIWFQTKQFSSSNGYCESNWMQAKRPEWLTFLVFSLANRSVESDNKSYRLTRYTGLGYVYHGLASSSNTIVIIINVIDWLSFSWCYWGPQLNILRSLLSASRPPCAVRSQ